MSKSAGQWIGTIAGAVAGFFLGGNVALGASLGGMLGGIIDPPKGPSVTGPRLDDQSFTASSLGVPLARGYGTFPVAGNIVWLEGDQYREVTTTEEQGGKGGGGQEVTSYKYYATFAVSLLRVTDPSQTVKLRRLWIGTDLVYDAADFADTVLPPPVGTVFADKLDSIIASSAVGQGVNFTFYSGTDDQTPNPRWQADKGVNAVSGFPGRAYIVIEDLDLTKYSNTLAMAQVKAELSVSSSTSTWIKYADLYDTDGVSPEVRKIYSVNPTPVGIEYYIEKSTELYNIPYAIDHYELVLGEDHRLIDSLEIPDEFGTPYTWTSPASITLCQSDANIHISVQERLASPITRVRFFNIGQDNEFSPSYITSDMPYAGGMTACHDAGETFIFGGLSTQAIRKFIGTNLSGKTSASYSILSGGVSENYLFGVANISSSQTTVYKFSRDDLSLIDTYTQSVPNGSATIYVESDSVFFTLALNHVYRWESGVVVADLGAVSRYVVSPLSSRPLSWFYVKNTDPPFVEVVFQDTNNVPQQLDIGYSIVPAAVASLRDIVESECGIAGVSASDLDLSALTDSDVRGYRISQSGSIRSALEQLQACFPFDLAQSGYKLRFVSRGGASLATILETDLGTHRSGDDASVLLPFVREMDSQLATKISVRHLDPIREYDIGEQYAERPALNSLNERTIDLSVVMTADEAAKVADILLSKEWVERVDIGPFNLPPTWKGIEAADIVTIEHRGQAHTARVTRAEYLNDGMITCSAKLSAAQSYTSTAVGETPAITGQSLVALKGTSTGIFLDVPVVAAQQNNVGMSFAAYGVASGWPGCVTLRSDDAGNSYQSVFSTNASASVFRANTSLGIGRTGIVDASSSLTISEVSRNPSLSSISLSSAASGQNLAAVGIDGRWEILSFLTVVDNGDDTWTVSDFVRGRYGTEWAIPLHQTGDMFILLSPSSVGFFGLPSAALGAARLYRTVTQGANLDSAQDESYTYLAENLRPLSPIMIKGHRDPITYDWHISWVRRSRLPVEPFSGVVTPIGESSEVYEVDVCDSSFSTVKRTFSGITSESLVISSANQISDYGANVTTVYLRVAQVSTVVGRGRQAEQSLTHVLPDDPHFAYVKLLMHMDDAALSDQRGNTIFKYGNIAVSSSESMFGGNSAVADGTGDYLTTYYVKASFDWWTTEFCLEGWVRPSDLSTFSFLDGATTVPALIGNASPSAAINYWSFGPISNGTVRFFYYSGAGRTVTSTETIAENEWSHIAVDVNSGGINIFVNGIGLGSRVAVIGTPQSNITYPLILGMINNRGINGFVDEFRLTLKSRYSANFTPNGPFPNP